MQVGISSNDQITGFAKIQRTDVRGTPTNPRSKLELAEHGTSAGPFQRRRPRSRINNSAIRRISLVLSHALIESRRSAHSGNN